MTPPPQPLKRALALDGDDVTPAIGLVERRQVLLPVPEIRSSVAVIGGPSSSSPTRPRPGPSQSQSQPLAASSSSVDSSAAKRRKRLRLECVEIPVPRPDLPRPSSSSSRTLRPTQSAPEIAFGAIGQALKVDAAKAIFAQTLTRHPALASRVAGWSVDDMARALGGVV